MEREGIFMDPKEGALEMRRYVDAGFTTFDMADHYGTSELIAGEYEAGWPGSGELLTKWVPSPGTVGREKTRAAVELALERMGQEQIDLLQFHAWSYTDPGWLDCIFCLQELKEEGLIKQLGVTNTDAAHVAMLLNSGVDVVSNQVCYSLLDQRARHAMTDLCLKCDIKLLAFGTLAGGFLTERWLRVPEPDFQSLETWSQMKYKRFIDAAGGWDKFQVLLAALERVAKRFEVSVANVASRVILDAPTVAGVIIGARLGKGGSTLKITSAFLILSWMDLP
ncbi:MAG: hypothetical protein Ct9H300mP15_10660 [Gemmatimonadota bacterium]|nr:MAG: hypothetical protein Ct9H300mP15_10660 [Gemmatimonadota bacterium]